jgi:ABC-type transport system involved in cytochrome c biogenesis permease subunit
MSECGGQLIKGRILLEFFFLAAALILYSGSLGLQLTKKNHLANTILIIAIGNHLAALVIRSVIAKHPPFTNLYETFILLPFLLSLRLVFWKEQIHTTIRQVLTGINIAIITLALLLPQSMKIPRPLMPALNSIWMYIHVPAYFFGYMAMLVAAVYGGMILFQKPPDHTNTTLLKRMDREVKIAFFCLLLGLITGAVWAYVSWGNYWAWDPKETWALINVIILSLYFHLNIPTKKKKAAVVMITLLSIVFTYWGVSFILTGLHSYT